MHNGTARVRFQAVLLCGLFMERPSPNMERTNKGKRLRRISCTAKRNSLCAFCYSEDWTGKHGTKGVVNEKDSPNYIF